MSDKTEAPTPQKLRDAREEGQVVRSVELNTAAIMLAGVLLLRGPGGGLVNAMLRAMTRSLRVLPQGDLTEAWLQETLLANLSAVLPSLGLLLVGLLLTGVGATLAQTKFLWSSKRIGFDAKRINPVNGFKRIFSGQALAELFKALVKLSFIIWTAYGYLNANYGRLLMLNQTDLRSAVALFADLSLELALRVGAVYLVVAAADYAYQRWELMKNLRMTKEEIKEEYKRSEGDPMIKGRIRQQMRRMARGRMMANVPKATVVVTNPTHLALAMEYRQDMPAPRLLAKGAHKVAQKIVAIAREKNIPIVQNIPLAHAIYNNVEIDQEITPDLYMAMAEVLAYVYRLRGQTQRRPAPQPKAS